MKITQAQLKQLIKEEYDQMAEQDGPLFHAKLTTWLASKLGQELGSLIGMAVSDYAPPSHQKEINRLVDELIISEGKEQ